MTEIRIDVSKQTPEELALAAKQAQLVFRFNNTMPGTPEYDALMHDIFPQMGDGSRVVAPVTVIRPHMVKIGRNVIVMPGCLMMSAGGITIEDGAQIAANVQLISKTMIFMSVRLSRVSPSISAKIHGLAPEPQSFPA